MALGRRLLCLADVQPVDANTGKAQRRDQGRQEREQQRRGLGYRGTRFPLSGPAAPDPSIQQPVNQEPGNSPGPRVLPGHP